MITDKGKIEAFFKHNAEEWLDIFKWGLNGFRSIDKFNGLVPLQNETTRIELKSIDDIQAIVDSSRDDSLLEDTAWYLLLKTHNQCYVFMSILKDRYGNLVSYDCQATYSTSLEKLIDLSIGEYVMSRFRQDFLYSLAEKERLEAQIDGAINSSKVKI